MTLSSDRPHIVLGHSTKANSTLDLGKRSNRQSITAGLKDGKSLLASPDLFSGKAIDLSWLPFASETYQISADINDYILVDVPIVTVDIPNRNCQAFCREEMTYYDPLLGRQIYKTFIGKASHLDHQNQIPRAAKGVIFDAVLQHVPKWDIWKIRILQGFDRTKDANLVRDILSGKRNGYSMGAQCSAFVCSVCGAIDTENNPCTHIASGKGSIFNGRLCYQITSGVNFFESSSVGDPADTTAESSVFWN